MCLLTEFFFSLAAIHLCLKRHKQGRAVSTSARTGSAARRTRRARTWRRTCARTRARSPTTAPGRAAAGSLRAATSWRATSASTRASGPFSVSCASAPSRAATTSPSTWSVTSELLALTCQQTYAPKNTQRFKFGFEFF